MPRGCQPLTIRGVQNTEHAQTDNECGHELVDEDDANTGASRCEQSDREGGLQYPLSFSISETA